ncbi:ribosome maturation factor RimP [Actinomadura rudentiformis]|uniref:Ribosome maturation factor RimP n=1 Tax=Actinomadura rudentiformis TaxID=359158 RepID=A0A6H9YDN8_9ACTN|nr:ribosome maturation factor RimP [Actinomadura rudentiformis]KAB2341751.1 ribosome maturation factor RimP [Actinomadura rudentiformis]
MSVESGGGSAQRSSDGRPSRDQAVSALIALLEPAVAEAGFDLEEVDVRPAGRRRLVKIVVDADGGVSLDDVATLSQTASDLLDGSNVMGTSPYVLEVTSPGVDRPLTEPRHWRRAVGRLVVAPLTAGGQIEGRVVEADETAVVLDVVAKGKGAGKGSGKAQGAGKGKGPGGPKGPKTTRRRFGLDELGRGRVQVEFRRHGDATDAGDAGDSGAPADEAEETRSPAEPD